MKKNLIIVIVIAAAIIGVGIWLASKSPAVPNQPAANPNIQGAQVLTRDYSHMTGSSSAKVVLVEFGDYQCPVCGAAYQPVKDVVDKYSSNPNFTFTFRNFPLPQHPYAQLAAETAEAAGAQGKYWQMHDLLYQNQNTWSGSVNPMSDFTSYARQLGLDANAFNSAVQSSKFIDQITQDQKDGEALGVDATPTFYLNGKQYVGLPDNLDGLVSQALAAK